MKRKFLVDRMPGSLARWLRILGFDALFTEEISKEALYRRALKEQRIVLTRDTHLRGREKVFFLTSEDLEEQVMAVLDHFCLKDKVRPLTRCPECNTPLAPVDKEKVRTKVPFHTFRTKQDFSLCPVCQKVYWEGNHHSRMMKRVKRLMKRLGHRE